MPIKKSIRASEKRRVINRRVQRQSLTQLKQARAVLATGNPEDAFKAVTKAISELDKASSKNVLHPNNVGRRKSRIAKKLAGLTAGKSA